MRGLPWWSSGWDSMLPMKGVWVQSLVRELDPDAPAKDPACCNETEGSEYHN